MKYFAFRSYTIATAIKVNSAKLCSVSVDGLAHWEKGFDAKFDFVNAVDVLSCERSKIRA